MRSYKDNGMLSITLTKDKHRVYTNAWRGLQYGRKHGLQEIIVTGAKIYSGDYKLMAAFLLSLEKLQ